MFLLLMAAPMAAANDLEREIRVAARHYHVPAEILQALAYEATRFDPDAESRWEGWGMYDLREGSMDPSLEHGAALLEKNPNQVATDWRLSVKAAAAILADQARSANGGELPDRKDLLTWWDAVRAFSGREQPNLQDQYATYIFEVISEGYEADTRWGRVIQAPRHLNLNEHPVIPPPTNPDSSLAYQFYAASSANYSDYSRGSGDIDMVVIHTTQGSYSGSISWFANPAAQASAHYVIRSSDGQITQCVKESDVAWHAGHWGTNLRSVGIEHEGFVDDPSYYTDAMYRASAALTLDIANRQGVTLTRDFIIGHSEVPGCSNGSGGGSGCHTDPGNYWDWDYYMALLTGGAEVTTGQLTGKVADSDIYNGAILPGATVWIGETGQSTTADASGYYHFYDLPFGTYTVHAQYPGYAEGTCGPKTTGSETDWCSIALYPAVDTGTKESQPEVDTGGTPDTGGETGGDDGIPGKKPPELPGTPTAMDEVGTCSTGNGPVFLGLLAPLLFRRRRK